MSGNREPTMRERSMRNNNSSTSKGLRLPASVKTFLIFSLAWSAVASFLGITGLWEFENDMWDAGFIVLSVGLPLISIVFIIILDEISGN